MDVSNNGYSTQLTNTMLEFIPLLAARKVVNDDWVGIVFFVVVVLVIIGGSIIATINKRVQETMRQHQMRQRRAGAAQQRQTQQPDYSGFGYGGYADPALPPVLPPPMPQAQRPQQQPQRSQKRRRQEPAVPPAGGESAVATPLASAQRASAPAQGAAARAVTASAEAVRVGRLVRRPDTLRAAFILSEVIGPCAALRPPDAKGRGA